MVPSVTEALFDFGLTENEIVGRTKFCIHPQSKVQNIERIGGTKNLNIEKIKALKPDLIFANREENVKEQVQELMKDFKVHLSDIATIEDNYYFLKELGHNFQKKELAQHYNLRIYDILQQNKISTPIKFAYLIWKDPYMAVGGDTFIHHVLKELGFENIFSDHKRYPIIEMSDLQTADLIMLSTEPYPFTNKHALELKEKLPNHKMTIVDGEAFSWYGTHLAKCESYFRDLISQIKNLQNL